VTILDRETATHNHPLHFGPEVALLLGECYEDEQGSELSFSLADSLLAGGRSGVQAAMSVFMELVMGRAVERHATATGAWRGKFRSKTVGAHFLATPTSEVIRGKAHIVCQSDDVYYVRVDLSCAAGLVASGTALWSGEE